MRDDFLIIFGFGGVNDSDSLTGVVFVHQLDSLLFEGVTIALWIDPNQVSSNNGVLFGAPILHLMTVIVDFCVFCCV